MDINKKELAKRITDDAFIESITQKLFHRYDLNKNNFLEKDELMNIMRDVAKEVFNCEPEDVALETEFEKLDKDKNNKIDISEFSYFIKQYINLVMNDNLQFM